ncbi:MAG: hypothetical protein JW942_08360 [Opitutales bacterium]|nr:hypothetical protein [Opitutales bacterium]
MDLIRIVEYGEHPHPKGLQRVTYEVAQRLERDFRSLRGRLARRFGGLPIYVGHPDDAEFSGAPGHSDTRAHGWVMELSAREDGLYGLVRWAKSGREFVENANYKFFSPRWVMRGVGAGVFEPQRLLSVGLTNTPNIPGDAICNEAASPALKEGERCVCVAVAGRSSGSETPASEAAPRDCVAANMPESFFRPRTAGLGKRRDSFGRRQAIVDAVQARMGEAGEDFATAWANLKRSRSDLF